MDYVLNSFEEVGALGGRNAGHVQFLLCGVLTAQANAQIVQRLALGRLGGIQQRRHQRRQVRTDQVTGRSHHFDQCLQSAAQISIIYRSHTSLYQC